MKKNLYELYQEWFKFCQTIYNIYEKIKDLELNKKNNTKEYYELKDLLMCAINFERKQADDINISSNNIDIIKLYFKNDLDKVCKDFFLDNNNGIEELRINNIIDMIIEENSNIELPVSNILEYLVNIQQLHAEINKRYENLYLLECSRHLIEIINHEVNSSLDLEYKKHLLDYKYNIIFTNRELENIYLEDAVLFDIFVPINNLHSTIPEIDYETFSMLNQKNLMTNVLENIYNIMFLSNDLLSSTEMKKTLYRTRVLIITYATMLADEDFIGKIFQEVNHDLVDYSLYDHKSIDVIYSILEDAKKYVERYNKIRKLTN